jgi:hypothetical protein
LIIKTPQGLEGTIMPYRTILAFLLLTSISAYGQNAPGRYLPDGRWQARNTKAALTESEDLPSNPFDISTI